MKFTMSKDGEKRTTLLIPYRIGRGEMIDLVAYGLSHDGAIGLDLQEGKIGVDELDELTKVRVERIIRDTLKSTGHETSGYWGDDCTEEARDALEEWVTEEIDRLFPELS